MHGLKAETLTTIGLLSCHGQPDRQMRALLSRLQTEAPSQSNNAHEAFFNRVIPEVSPALQMTRNRIDSRNAPRARRLALDCYLRDGELPHHEWPDTSRYNDQMLLQLHDQFASLKAAIARGMFLRMRDLQPATFSLCRFYGCALPVSRSKEQELHTRHASTDC